MRMNQQVKLYPVGKDNTYFYQTIPFLLAEVVRADNQEIPLVLYGSGWEDTRYDVVRFCGESEIDLEKKVDILSKIPHHYVLGLELKKTE